MAGPICRPRFGKGGCGPATAALSLFVLGCTALAAAAGAGEFSGKVTLRSIGGTRFAYLPDKDNPFTFTTSDGRLIRPERMYTDGGTLPPVFWVAPKLSPWEYGPAYVIHDWLFRQHHCRYPGYESITFEESARILNDAIDTLQRQGLAAESRLARHLIDRGARSWAARAIWGLGVCTQQTSGFEPTEPAPPTSISYDFTVPAKPLVAPR